MASRLAITTTPTPGRKQKTDIAWKHCEMINSNGKIQLMCVHCQKIFKGGGIHRIKEHLAGHKGNGSVCHRVPADIQTLMRENLQISAMKSRRKRKPGKRGRKHGDDEHEMEEDEQSEKFSLPYNDPIEPNSSLFDQPRKEIDEGKYGIEIPDAVTVIARTPILRPTPSNVVVARPGMTNQQVHMAIGRFLYDIGAPMGSVNSVHFQPMIDAIASCGSGVVGPSYHDIRGPILKNVVKEMKSNTEKYRLIWERTGCSIIVEQCSDKSRSLLNFLVHCPEGTIFFKSVEAPEFIDSPDSLVEVIKEVVVEIGEKNVLQVITSGEEHFATAGQTLMRICPNLYWAPCAAQCIDLILKDFGECDWIHSLISNAQSMTRFIYNHPTVLNLMRRFTFGNDIVEPGGSRFATNFVTLRQIAVYKVQLQSMVTSQEWMVNHPYSKRPEALEMLDLLTSEQFWSSCNLATQLTNPLLRLLRIVSEKNGSMGYVYAGMYRAKEAIKKELLKKGDYLWFWNRIDYRWEQYQHLPLQAAGFFLNPKFFYSVQGDVPNKIVSAVFDCIERLVPEETVQDKIIKEINSYKVADGDFGRNMAVRGRDTLNPVEWWSTYGGACPNLTRLAIRILGQTCSARFGKVISFDQMLDASNCLERRRLTDRAFVQYNLQLRVNKTVEQDLLDPIASEAGPLLEDWITGKEVPVDSENQDWMSVDPPSNISTLFGPCEIAIESLQLHAGFDDYEIFNEAEVGIEDAVDIARG